MTGHNDPSDPIEPESFNLLEGEVPMTTKRGLELWLSHPKTDLEYADLEYSSFPQQFGTITIQTSNFKSLNSNSNFRMSRLVIMRIFEPHIIFGLLYTID